MNELIDQLDKLVMWNVDVPHIKLKFRNLIAQLREAANARPKNAKHPNKRTGN